jgi:hypothetical protein
MSKAESHLTEVPWNSPKFAVVTASPLVSAQQTLFTLLPTGSPAYVDHGALLTRDCFIGLFCTSFHEPVECVCVSIEATVASVRPRKNLLKIPN